MKNDIREILRRYAASAVTATLLTGASPLFADEDYEYEVAEGYHEEEWYDPSDWFNGDSAVAYEYDESYYDDDYWSDDSLLFDDWTYTDYDDITEDTEYGEVYEDGVFQGDGDWADDVLEERDGIQKGVEFNDDIEWDEGVTFGDEFTWDAQDATWATTAEASSPAKKTKKAAHREVMQASGTVDGFKKIRLRKKGEALEEHHLVKIRMKDGRSVAVNLGPKRGIKDLDLEKGDNVRITGKPGEIHGKKILVAKSVEIDGEMFKLRSKNPNVMVTGEFEAARRATVGKEEHIITNLKLDNGKRIAVDLGPKAKISEMDLEKGDTLRVRGRRATVNGKSVLIANKLAVCEKERKGKKRSEKSY